MMDASAQRCRVMDLRDAILCDTKDVHQSKCSGLLLFSHGRCHVLFRSAQCAISCIAHVLLM